jgi:ThiF family
MSKHYYVIGCGGVGSWLAPALCLLRSPGEVTLVDGDKLEKKNLSRQLFDESNIGENKAEALARKYGCLALPLWYSTGLITHNIGDWVFCCADNNLARMAVLSNADGQGVNAIIAANETTSSEAYHYRRSWRDTPLDPRVYYPEMVDDTSNDPRAASIGCTGEPQLQNRQLVSANMSAASLALNLFVVWGIKLRTLDKEVIPSLPFKYVSNMTRLETFLIKEEYEKNNI